MPRTWRVATIILANIILLAAIAIFAAGFFPYKAFLPGLAAWTPNSVRVTSPSPFDKVVFMVVDALRSDFVYSNTSDFHFTQQLIREGAAVPFTGHASPPTITMPRVKAITTGSVPSFVDLVLNFAESDTTSTLATQDSWLAQLRAKGTGKLVMYGDDTWLRLFPGFFDRADGTTSFFVSDFTEVDSNVTRHVDGELRNDDWSAMTFHYLGLDHIGHKTGPRGPNMPAKQAEMDGIVKKVYEAFEREPHLQSSLLVLLGDHGMNEGGNHGANSAGEVSTALTFISPKFKGVLLPNECPTTPKGEFEYYQEVEQSDIAPTLAALLDFPIPRNNLGIVIPQLLSLWPNVEDRYKLLYANAQQIWQIVLATFPTAASITQQQCTTTTYASDAEHLACLWLSAQAPQPLIPDLQPLLSFLTTAQRTLSSTASNYDTTLLLQGTTLSALALLLSLVTFILTPRSTSPFNTPFSLTIYTALLLLYPVTLFATSYIEEEHQFWHWLTSFVLLLLVIKSLRYTTTTTTTTTTAITNVPSSTTNTSFSTSFALLPLLPLHLLTRRHLQTGQKFAGAPSLTTTLYHSHPYLLWILIILVYAFPSRTLSRRFTSAFGSKHAGVVPVMVAMLGLVFKIAFAAADAPELVEGVGVLRPVVGLTKGVGLVGLGRVSWWGLGMFAGVAVWVEQPWRGRKELGACVGVLEEVGLLVWLMQSRVGNGVVFLWWRGMRWALREGVRKGVLGRGEVGVLGLLLQVSGFFVLGGSNAISTVDLSSAYNGVGGYDVLAVGVLTFVGNWAGSLYWVAATVGLLVEGVEERERSGEGRVRVRDVVFEQFVLLTVFVCVTGVGVMGACFVLREHLFIWTVFSPRYLYLVAWTVGWHVVVNGLIGTGLVALCGP